MMLADELRQAPQAVARQAGALAAPLAELGERLRRRPPQVVRDLRARQLGRMPRRSRSI